MLRVSGRIWSDDGQPDPIFTEAIQHPVEELPAETLQFLLSSRYCEVDQLSQVAGDMFGHTTPGWARAVWIRDWVHNHVRFDYNTARPTKTALDVFTERVGVCRDYQHLAVAMTRAMNIPARYVTGYLGEFARRIAALATSVHGTRFFSVADGGRWMRVITNHVLGGC